MGQNSLYCRTESTAKDFISGEIKIYKWRADPNCNAHLPKVTFKNALSYRQQEKYIQFMMLHDKKDAIQIHQLKAQLQLIPDLANQEVIVFQKYSSSLEKIQNLLTLEESLYCLNELLFGFQQIKKMYMQIVVSSKCCFVTKDGQIRAWISPNPKCNKIESDKDFNLFAERQYKEIISSIFDIAFQAASKTTITCNFFASIRTAVKQTLKRSEIFAWIRSIIEQYAMNNRLCIKTLKGYLLRMEEQKQLTNSCLEQQIKLTPTQDQTFMGKSNRPEFYSIQIKPSFLQSKAFQSLNSKQSETSYTTKTSFPNFNSINHSNQINFTNLSGFHQLAHSVVPCESHLFGATTKKSGESSVKTTVRCCQALQKCQKPLKQMIKASSIDKEVIVSPPLLPCRSSISESLKISISNFSHDGICHERSGIQSADIKMDQIDHTNSFKRQSKYKLKNQEDISEIKNKRSIITNMINNSTGVGQTIKQTQHQQKLKACSQVRCGSSHSINSSSEAHRPWITTKTITKLISDTPSESLVHSVGTSESQISSQLYSGVLTQLARDSNEKKVSSTSINEF